MRCAMRFVIMQLLNDEANFDVPFRFLFLSILCIRVYETLTFLAFSTHPSRLFLYTKKITSHQLIKSLDCIVF